MWISLKTLRSKVLATFADHHDELSIDERDSDGFISRLVVCSSSDSSWNLTDSSQITVGYQLRFLALLRVIIKRGTGNEEMGNGETWK